MRLKHTIIRTTILLCCAGLMLLMCCKSDLLNSSSYFQLDNYDADLVEYHTTAVNLAEAGKFPYMGYLLEDDKYHFKYLDADNKEVSDNFISKFFKNTGVGTFIRKPPVYPLFLATLYKAFSVDARVVYAAQILLLLVSAFLLAAFGYFTAKINGAIAGGMAAIIFVIIKMPMAQAIDPEIFVSFLLSLFFLLEAVLLKAENKYLRFLQGFVISLVALTRGTVIPPALLFAGYQFLSAVIKRTSILPFLQFVSGMMPVLICWMIYANTFNIYHLEDRINWAQKNQSQLSEIEYNNNISFLNQPDLEQCIQSILLKEYVIYAATQSFIIITPQAEGDQILAMHNEFTSDGSFHFEWPLIKNSFHNTHYINESPLSRVFFFYHDNPEYLPQMIYGKLSVIFNEKWRIFFVLMLPLLWIQWYYVRNIKAPVLITIFLLCYLLLSIIVFPGDPLFIGVIDGLLLFYGFLTIVNGTKKLQRLILKSKFENHIK